MKEDILSFLDSFSSDLGAILPRLLASVVILIVGYLVGRLAALLVRRFILYLDRIINVPWVGHRLGFNAWYILELETGDRLHRRGATDQLSSI